MGDPEEIRKSGETAAAAVHLRQMWNARGAADIAKLETEIPNVYSGPLPDSAPTGSVFLPLNVGTKLTFTRTSTTHCDTSIVP
jgi:hypothetical protein